MVLECHVRRYHGTQACGHLHLFSFCWLRFWENISYYQENGSNWGFGERKALLRQPDGFALPSWREMGLMRWRGGDSKASNSSPIKVSVPVSPGPWHKQQFPQPQKPHHLAHTYWMSPTQQVVCIPVKSLQLCLTLCNPMDCSPPDSSVHGILQARILEWIAMPSCRESSQPRDRTVYLRCKMCLFHLLHWQVGSLSLAPPSSPLYCVGTTKSLSGSLFSSGRCPSAWHSRPPWSSSSLTSYFKYCVSKIENAINCKVYPYFRDVKMWNKKGHLRIHIILYFTLQWKWNCLYFPQMPCCFGPYYFFFFLAVYNGKFQTYTQVGRLRSTWVPSSIYNNDQLMICLPYFFPCFLLPRLFMIIATTSVHYEFSFS